MQGSMGYTEAGKPIKIPPLQGNAICHACTGRGEQESDTRGTKEPGESYTDAKLVGELRFHVSPVVTPTTDDNTQDEPESIQIRHFIDAGWMYTRDIRVYHYMLSKL